MQILFFGTFDERTHPRVRVLREGLAAHGHETLRCNAPLGLSTLDRVSIARQPWRVPLLVARVGRRWLELLRTARGLRPDVVVVGYLGHFDVHLARWRFRSAMIVLDHMIALGDTARDRGIDRRPKVVTLLDAVDRAAVRAADVVVVDTDEHAALVPAVLRPRVAVAAVGAPQAWFDARRAVVDGPALRLVFFGLFTPLQGAPVIAEALQALRGTSLTCTMIGAGQDLAATRSAVGDDARVVWVDWVDEQSLPAIVASHHVCLGIFGDSPKAHRVVPNKVFQGAAAGCAVVTSDTAPQRRVLSDAACLVAPGDPAALARALKLLVEDPSEVARLRAAAADVADRHFTASAVVEPLVERLGIAV